MSQHSLTPFPITARAIAQVLENLRRGSPRVHCITNPAAVTLSANVLLAVGAMPSVTANPREIISFVSTSHALLINLGAITQESEQAIGLAVETAQKNALPWLLDPVFTDRSPYRRQKASALLLRHPTVFKANAQEIVHFSTIPDDVITVATGPVDRISNHAQTISIANGHPLGQRVTGIGCALGALIAAFMAIEHNRLLATAAATAVWGIVLELSAEKHAGPGSFAAALTDELFALTPEKLEKRLRLT